MEFKSINPYNGKVIETFREHTADQLNEITANSGSAFIEWKKTSFSYRSKLMVNASEILLKNIDKYAADITREMGKPITESRGEIKKCAWVCEYYAQNGEKFLANETIKTDANQSFVSFEPLGSILAIMPWNFPFWQVFRFAAPSLMAGNTALLKHASNVFRSALNIEEVFKLAGFPEDVFQSLIIHHDKIESIIESNTVKAVTLTGSGKAGSSVAAIAGKNIKKTVLELGGSNAFIVLEDADIEKTADIAVKARMLNAGQSCIAAKRFIILDKVYDEFLSQFINRVKKIKSGNPLEESTEIGPLARKDLAEQLHEQVLESVKGGAEILLGGKMQEAFYEPTVLVNVKPEMPVFEEETFGPVAPVIRAKNEKEAFNIANKSKFGLGISLFTKDIEKAREYISMVSDGAFFINEMVKSDPRLPFGGTKFSGYGRELSKDGIMEFVNKKTIYINS
jgi:succinate-semialdehyde dehydrogenase/glutarate-semialdehyde dehydrogenase